jgi:phage anti-repressor protein
MNELIKVVKRSGKQAVNARDLHKALEVGRDFSNWIKGRIEEYSFVEGEDFHLDSPKLANQDAGWGGDRRSINYLLSVDMAKEIAIVENNDIGRRIRRYLIKVEEEYITLLKSIQNVYDQNENYRIKYINLLEKLENEGMTTEEIWKLSRIDRTVLQKLRELLPRNCEK